MTDTLPHASPSSETDACPSPTQVLGWVDGELAPGARSELEAHLADCPDCRRLVSALGANTQGKKVDLVSDKTTDRGLGPTRSSNHDEVLDPGGLADRYELIENIGRGGMGLVIKARHRALDRDVALKLLDAPLATSEEAARRFLREARAAANIESDHIVSVLDAGLLSDGQPFIAMELLRGRDLAAEIELRGPLPIEEAVDFMLQACLGLAAAHAAGIVHRDVKPPNLFLAERSDGTRVLKVLDFGIAKMNTVSATTGPKTPQGAIVGTPRYMAPEQLKASQSVDARADVWALGVVLYEALSARPAFAGDQVHELLASVLMDTPAPLESLRADVPPGLTDVITRALTKNPDERFGDIAAFASALAAFGGPDATVLARRAERLARGGNVVSVPPSGGPVKPGLANDPTTPAIVSGGTARMDATPPPTARAQTNEGPSLAPAPSRRWPLIAAAVGAIAAVTIGIAFTSGGESQPEVTNGDAAAAKATADGAVDESATTEPTKVEQFEPEPSGVDEPANTATPTAPAKPSAPITAEPAAPTPATAPKPTVTPAPKPTSATATKPTEPPAPKPTSAPKDLLDSDAMSDRK